MTDQEFSALEQKEKVLWEEVKIAQDVVHAKTIPWSEAHQAIQREKLRREVITDMKKEQP